MTTLEETRNNVSEETRNNVSKLSKEQQIHRREFLGISLVIASFPIALTALGQDIDVSSLGFDIGNPQSHCNQSHHHDPLPENINPVDQLKWSAQDTGFNEGAEEGIRLLLKYGVGLPDGLADLGGKVAGNVWKRRDMMKFAKDLAKSGNVPVAVGLGILSQWHNCHAFRTLINNVPTVTRWMLS